MTNKRGGGLRFRSFTRPGKEPIVGVRPFPKGRVFYFCRIPYRFRHSGFARSGDPLRQIMDKDRKEALQVAKELTAKFIETRTVSPGNFAEIFPAVYRVVYAAIRENADETEGMRA